MSGRERAQALESDNVLLLSQMRAHLSEVSLLENIPLMRQFNDNIAEALRALDTLDVRTPLFPVRVNTMYLSGDPTLPGDEDAR